MAAANGTAADHMNMSEINETLQNVVARSALPQAVRLSMEQLRPFYPDLDAEELYKKIRFRANPSLSFQKSELSAAVMKRSGDGVYIELTLNFLAVFGSASPLPSHYSEAALRSVDGDGVLRDFMDLFNHRLQTLVYPIWLKHRYYVQYQNELTDPFSKYMLSLLGLYGEQHARTSRLDLKKLMPYLGILGMRRKSSGMLLSVLRHYLSHEEIRIEQCVADTVTIPSWQHSRLGTANSTMGRDFLMGESVKSRSGNFRIVLQSIPWEKLAAYSVHGTMMEELKELIAFMLNEPLEFEVVLHLQKSQIPQCRLGSEASGCLGVNSVLGLPRGNLEVTFAS
jgi:type VI secretion system protein ImpH